MCLCNMCRSQRDEQTSFKHDDKMWSPGGDLNPGSPDYKSGAVDHLATEAQFGGPSERIIEFSQCER